MRFWNFLAPLCYIYARVAGCTMAVTSAKTSILYFLPRTWVNTRVGCTCIIAIFSYIFGPRIWMKVKEGAKFELGLRHGSNRTIQISQRPFESYRNLDLLFDLYKCWEQIIIKMSDQLKSKYIPADHTTYVRFTKNILS